MLEDAISTGPRWLYVISGYKMQITPWRQFKSAPFARFCVWAFANDHLFILGSIYTTHWRHWHGGTGIITPFQTVPAISVWYKPVLTSGDQLALLVVSHCPSKNRNPSKQDDLSQTIFHVTVSIFWELDISIQDYEVQGGTKEDLNRDALEAAKDDAWEAQISNSPSWLDLLC